MSQSARAVALDWMRGVVMVLMTVDHASVMFNAGRVANDTVATHVPGSPLPLGQFLTRWVTHLCAPTFVFLAGAGIALSAARRDSSGEGGLALDRDLRVRGLLLLALDLFYISLMPGRPMFQVLAAIGCAMFATSFLRHLPWRVLLGLGLGWFVVGELVTDIFWDPPQNSSVLAALLVARSVDGQAMIFYPVIPWLAMMLLGFVFGGHLHRHGAVVAGRTLARWGAGALVVFLVVRGLAGYGNMWLQREGSSLQQWLHVSKYPPSLTYATLELGLMALCLAALLFVSERVAASQRNPILVFGQTALFFYLAHFTLLAAARQGLGVDKGGLPRVYLAAALLLAVLYPACLWFRARKRAAPRGLLRFV